ncbi:LmbU family transcriptional regulator [Streptomyces sp. NPDC004126]|uniref:LmbU family transcriptional regulator n=1 Tax=Streptomyces sp. NPDC004126 TaxID=3390695 RepID=UPI003D02CB4F
MFDQDKEKPATSRPPAAIAREIRRRTTLTIPRGISMEAWRSLGQQIEAISNSSSWWLGDWLIYGQSEFPNRYKHAIAQTSLDYQTLRNYAWVARSFKPNQRLAELSFQHHAEVAGMEPEERGRLLKQAAEHGWSRNELRRQVRSRRATVEEERPVPLKIKPNDDQRERWQAAAQHTSQDLLTWITTSLDDAVDTIPTAGG